MVTHYFLGLWMNRLAAGLEPPGVVLRSLFSFVLIGLSVMLRYVDEFLLYTFRLHAE